MDKSKLVSATLAFTLRMAICTRNPMSNYLTRVRVWLFFLPIGNIMGKKLHPAGKAGKGIGLHCPYPLTHG
jgi:hypothetical protein